MDKGKKILFKVLFLFFAFIFTAILINSSFDIYNNFAYDKAILRESPYGYTPMLQDVNNYHSGLKNIRSGEFVYVEDWISEYDGRIVFAKVRSKFEGGYINRDLLVKTNINVIPVISILLLLGFVYLFVKNIIRRIN